MIKTKRIRNRLVQLSVLAGLGSLLVTIQPLVAQSSAFDYQDFLTDQGGAANGNYDLRFTIYDSASDGNVSGEPAYTSDLSVTNGLFAVTLDFGSAVFDGGDRWLEIGVRPTGSIGEFTSVVPRRKINPTPYAIRAANFSGPVDASQITGHLAATNIADGTITSDKLAAGAVAAHLTAEGQDILVLNGGGLTNLNASALTSGTIPGERFPAMLPAIDGSQLTGISDVTKINSHFGQGTNTDLLDPSYRGILSSTNAYPVVRARTDLGPYVGQVWQQIYTSDTNAAPFTSFTGVAPNGFNPAVNAASPFSALNDVQWHHGYNMSQAPGYNRDLPTWVRGFESTWFNPYRPPVMEVYDRYVLTNGIVGNAGFGYDLRLEDGYIEATIDAHTLSFRNPTTGFKWMDATSNTNGDGVLTLGNHPYGSGYINFNSTNEWLIVDGGRGIIGARGSNYLFSSGGGGTDMITMLKGANTAGAVLGIQVGSVAPRGLRWQGTNSNSTLRQWEYQLNDGTWRRIAEDLASNHRRTYTIPANTGIGATSADYRTLGVLTNVVTDIYKSVIVQFDLMTYSGGSMRTVFLSDHANSHSDWQELLPLHQSKRNDSYRFAVDVRFQTDKFEFRLRRTGATGIEGVSSFQGVVTVYATGSANTLWITDVSGSGSGATVSQHDQSTPMIQTAGKVGINTNNPQAALDVGNAGNVFASGFLVRSNGWKAIPVLREGDVWLGSSNGILHSISLVGGNYTTNRMVP